MKSCAYLLGSVLMLGGAYAADPNPTANVHRLMKNVIAVQTQAIWDITNHAQDDNGNPDPSKLKPADWSRIVSAADKVKRATQTLGQAEHLMAAAPGEKLENEGDPGAFDAKAVQKTIDANPNVFKAFAQGLAATMDEVVAAARANDAKKLGELSGQLDTLCEQCHTQFWYPEQNKKR